MNSRRAGFTMMAVALTIATASCGNDAGPPSYLGHYSLQSVNGDLPFRILHNDTDGQWIYDVMSGSLVLDADKTFSEVLTYRVTPPTGAQFDSETTTDGKYALSGETIIFTYSPDNRPTYSWSGTVAPGTITYLDPLFTDVAGGIIAVYIR